MSAFISSHHHPCESCPRHSGKEHCSHNFFVTVYSLPHQQVAYPGSICNRLPHLPNRSTHLYDSAHTIILHRSRPLNKRQIVSSTGRPLHGSQSLLLQYVIMVLSYADSAKAFPTAARAFFLPSTGQRIQVLLPTGTGDHPIPSISDVIADTGRRYPKMVVATIK